MSIQGSINSAIGSLGQATAIGQGLKKLDTSIKQASPEAQAEAAAKIREQERQENIARSKENITRHEQAYKDTAAVAKTLRSAGDKESAYAQNVIAAQNLYDEQQKLYSLDPTPLNLVGAYFARDDMMTAQENYQKAYDKLKAQQAMRSSKRQQQTKAELKQQTKSFIETNWNSWGQTNDPNPKKKLEV